MLTDAACLSCQDVFFVTLRCARYTQLPFTDFSAIGRRLELQEILKSLEFALPSSYTSMATPRVGGQGLGGLSGSHTILT